MNTLVYRTLMLVGVSCLGLAQPVYAQDDRASVAPEEPGIQDIVVTARKRAEAAQSVPISITAFSPQLLQEKQIVAITDLANHTAGMTLQSSTTPTLFAVQIRGQNTVQTTLNLDPAIGIYVDGVYIGPDIGNAVQLNFDDAASAEILKGPQGTLYGRNTSGGAIKLDHVLPGYEVNGWAKVGYGNFDWHSVSGAVTLPLADEVATVRLYGKYSDRDGYGENPIRNQDLLDSRRYSFSGTLRLDPAPGLRVVVRGNYDHDKGGNVPLRPVAVNSGSGGATTLAGLAIAAHNGLPITRDPTAPLGFTLSPATAAAADALWRAGIAPGFYDQATRVPLDTSFEGYNGSVTVDYDISDTLQLRSISAHRDIKNRRNSDLTGSSAALGLFVVQPLDYHQFTQEFTANGSGFGEKLKYTLGAFYLDSKGRDSSFTSTTPILGTVLGAASPVPTSVSIQVGEQMNKSFAVYGQGTFEIAPKLNVTAGLRWTSEKKTLDSHNQFGLATFDPVSWAVTQLPPVLNQTLFCSQAQQGVGDACLTRTTTKFKKLTYLGSVDYEIAPSVLAYAKISRGFRSGGGQLYSGGVGAPFAPEIVDDYEIGLKADLLDRRLRVNVALFHDDYKDIQKFVYMIINNNLNSVVVNAASAKVQGAEFELTAKPVDNLTLGFTGAYTKPKYKSFVDPLTGRDLSDIKFQGIAKLTWTASIGYQIPTSFGKVSLDADYWHTSDVPLAPDAGPLQNGAAPYNTQQAYGLLNGRVAVELEDQRLTISAWAKNILKKKYFNYNFDILQSVGYAASFGNLPRTWGIEATYRF